MQNALRSYIANETSQEACLGGNRLNCGDWTPRNIKPCLHTIDKQSRAQCESRLAMEPQSVCGIGDRKDTKVAIDVKIYHTISL
jgi:hypothetical protein